MPQREIATPNPTEEQLSSYKKAVLDELTRYRSGIHEPGLIRGWFGTDPERMQSVNAVLDKLDTHDLVFLYTVIKEGEKVRDRNSRFRDVVGKAALSQLYHYLAGVAETFVAFQFLRSLISLSPSGIFFYATLGFVADTIDRYFQKGVQQQAGLNGLSLADDENPTELFDFLKRNFYELSVDKFLTSSQSVAGNVVNFLQSNYLFFRKNIGKLTENTAPAERNTPQHR